MLRDIFDFIGSQAARNKSPDAPALIPADLQDYYAVLCNVDGAFNTFKGLADEVGTLLDRFGAQMKDDRVQKLTQTDGLCDTWLGVTPLAQAARIAHQRSSIGDDHLDALEKFGDVDYRYPYIIEKILFVADRVPEIQTDPRNTHFYVLEEIDRTFRAMYQPAPGVSAPRSRLLPRR